MIGGCLHSKQDPNIRGVEHRFCDLEKDAKGNYEPCNGSSAEKRKCHIWGCVVAYENQLVDTGKM